MAMETQVRPPLVAGDRLSQPEFHRLYHLMPPKVKARLIDGVVYIEGEEDPVTSPVSSLHAIITSRAATWLGTYEWRTEGVLSADNPTLVLGPKNEPQPDLLLAIRVGLDGGLMSEGGYFRGVPGLVVEVSVSSRWADLRPQRDDYERAGIPEYIVFATEPPEVIWHMLRGGELLATPPDPDGLYRSRSFPGLWLDPAAFWAADLPALRATLERGLASPEHAEFAARLRAIRDQPRVD